MTEIAPSLLGADLLHLGDEVEKCRRAGIHVLHFDQMDGHFVPNISFGPAFVAAVRKQCDLFLDVHLMLSDPLSYVKAFADAGADRITVHAEIEDPRAALLAIRARGLQAGICLKPATAPEAIVPFLPLVDQILVMTVEPGFGGQSLREDCVAKLPVLRRMIKETGRPIVLEVDGGVKADNARRILDAGADCLVMGTGFFQAEHPEELVRAFMQ